MITSRENMEKVFNHVMPDWVPHLSYDTYTIKDYCVERPIMTDGIDGWGVHWIPCEKSLNITHPDTQNIILEELEEWREKVKFPDLDSTDFTEVKEMSKDIVDRKEKMVCYISLNGIFERTHILMGFENALCAFMEDPDNMEELCCAIADHKIKLFKKIWEICQPDILVYHDDWATQMGPFLPTGVFEQCIKQNTKRIVTESKNMGYKYILHHSCGKIESRIQDIIDCGFDGWDSAQPCNNLDYIKKHYGDKLVIATGLDAQGVVGNSKSTTEDLKKEVESKIDMLGKDGGLIIDSTVAYSLNPKNEEIILKETIRYGREYCLNQLNK